MSILNQSSITITNGHSIFPSRGSAGSHDDSPQQLPMPPLRAAGTNYLSIAAASTGDPPPPPPHGGSFCRRVPVLDQGSISTGISELLAGKDNPLLLPLDQTVIRTVHDDDLKCKTKMELVQPPSSSSTTLQISFPARSIMEGEKLNLSTNGQPNDDNVLIVVISSAVRLEGKQIDLISRKMQRLTGRLRNYLKLENIIDPSLIAGFVISYDSDGSHVIDLSVRGQLAALAARVESWDQRSGSGQKIASHGHGWSFRRSLDYM